VPLPVFMGSCPIPQPNWGYEFARRDLCSLQPLREVVQQLWFKGLMGADLLWTFFSYRVQPLRQRVMTMWMYPGPCCPDRPFSKELGDIDINTHIHRVFAHEVDLSPVVSPAHKEKGSTAPG
jgi:hypothetical protein